MRLTTTLLIKALVSAAMLTGLGAHAQTTAETTETKTAPRQDFVGLLATADLNKQGITEPTEAEMDDAVKSIQDQRASGMGWGEIANSLGLKLGAVVSAANRNKHAEDNKRTETTDKRKGAKGTEDSQRGESGDTHGGKGSSSKGGDRGGSGGGNGGGGGGGGKK